MLRFPCLQIAQSFSLEVFIMKLFLELVYTESAQPVQA